MFIRISFERRPLVSVLPCFTSIWLRDDLKLLLGFSHKSCWNSGGVACLNSSLHLSLCLWGFVVFVFILYSSVWALQMWAKKPLFMLATEKDLWVRQESVLGGCWCHSLCCMGRGCSRLLCLLWRSLERRRPCGELLAEHPELSYPLRLKSLTPLVNFFQTIFRQEFLHRLSSRRETGWREGGHWPGQRSCFAKWPPYTIAYLNPISLRLPGP